MYRESEKQLRSENTPAGAVSGILRNDNDPSDCRDKWNRCEIRYGDMKKQLATDIIAVTKPIRERILELEKDTDYLQKVTQEGAEKARESASKTIREVREIMGFKSF